MFQMRMFMAEATIRAGHLPLGTAKLSPRASRIAASVRIPVARTMLRKVSTGSSPSAILNSGQLVPQTTVSSASSTSTLGGTRTTRTTGQTWCSSGACRMQPLTRQVPSGSRVIG